jgi:hypothetical protein
MKKGFMSPQAIIGIVVAIIIVVVLVKFVLLPILFS